MSLCLGLICLASRFASLHSRPLAGSVPRSEENEFAVDYATQWYNQALSSNSKGWKHVATVFYHHSLNKDSNTSEVYVQKLEADKNKTMTHDCRDVDNMALRCVKRVGYGNGTSTTSEYIVNKTQANATSSSISTSPESRPADDDSATANRNNTWSLSVADLKRDLHVNKVNRIVNLLRVPLD
eukprot:CAMPEP_0177578954 /NCGR_PEP_ID=MMETSP0419_2-20121207/655_1 /TAXON_ID=582737 /ORGANISM="Tetraselmis sp., Strain GSL018" /LENGTH=182 /DNA_ID=CAMNT_0019067495 /DNA_START=109 /DNA_END=657 /DNA_ORIENTATION=+